MSAAWRAVVITVSDRVHTGTYQDKSGPAAREKLQALGFEIGEIVVVPDEAEQITPALISCSERLISRAPPGGVPGQGLLLSGACHLPCSAATCGLY